VSHLGDNLSALVDGELSGADADRANAHLASCGRCRGEAAALRLLKRELHALVADAGDEDALTRRLLAMAVFPSDQAPDTMRAPRPRPAFRTYQEAWDRGSPRMARHRYFVWGAVSLAVVGGLGAAAFTMGGGAPGAGTGPGVVPPVEVFNVEHAADSGYVPFPDAPATNATERGANLAIQRKP
jgi:anti-sigma factor RsiW